MEGRWVKRVWCCSLLCLALVGGCGSSDEDEPNASGLAPEELCDQKCTLQVAAGCPSTPSDYLESCKLLCMAKYQNFPNCTDQTRPLDVCAIERVSYSCTNGTLTATPTGACAAQGAECATCTGDFFNCL